MALCRHIKTNGVQCRAIQLRGRQFCYFHDRLRFTHIPYRAEHLGATRHHILDIGATDTHEAMQIALSTVINALATDQIDTRRATALLYGLQLASLNAGKLPATEPDPGELVHEVTRDGLALSEEHDQPEEIQDHQPRIPWIVPEGFHELFDQDPRNATQIYREANLHLFASPPQKKVQTG